jgi:hypothetical protein
VNQENVLRFRHECFLMKNLAHPNVVKLVGVCWDDSLFACCLEFVENGTVEMWLRRTPAGQTYVPPRQKAALRPAATVQELLARATFRGFDCDGQYNPAEHTKLDEIKLREALALLETAKLECQSAPWIPSLKADGSPLDWQLKAYHKVGWLFGEGKARGGK